MTPLEINQKIAEIKGYIPGLSSRVDWPNGVSLNKESVPKGFFDICAENKNWAENISDAMELYEELVNIWGNESYLVIYKSRDVWYLANYGYGDDHYDGEVLTDYSEAATLSMAICKQWLESSWRLHYESLGNVK